MSSNLFHLIRAVPHFGVLLLQHHPESSECHKKAVAHVPEHHRKQEWKCNDGVECYRNIEKVSQRGYVALLHGVRVCVLPGLTSL